MTFDGEFFRSVAMRGMTERFGEMVTQQPYRLHLDHPVYTLVQGEQPFVHAADLVVDWAALLAVDPMSRAAAEEGGVRTVLMVPLRKDNTLLGIIIAQRREVRPFSESRSRCCRTSRRRRSLRWRTRACSASCGNGRMR